LRALQFEARHAYLRENLSASEIWYVEAQRRRVPENTGKGENSLQKRNCLTAYFPKWLVALIESK
jgi:hypothetical protein